MFGLLKISNENLEICTKAQRVIATNICGMTFQNQAVFEKYQRKLVSVLASTSATEPLYDDPDILFFMITWIY